MCTVGDIVLPGETVQNLECHNDVIIVGPGLRRHTDEEIFIVTRPGKLCYKTPNVYWVESNQKRYIAKKGDLIVGIVSIKRGDVLKIDIGSSELASLSIFAFEGATKKQKPDVQIGDVIYARLLSAHREMEPELVCVDSYFKAGKLGVLSNGGFVFNINQEFAYKLLTLKNPLLKTLGKKMTFEVAVGMNGKVWINANTPKNINTVYSTLLAAEKQSDQDISALCNK